MKKDDNEFSCVFFMLVLLFLRNFFTPENLISVNMLEDRNFPDRIVNLRYIVRGLHFDAAIDCNWVLHSYNIDRNSRKDLVPIELYCLDHAEWG